MNTDSKSAPSNQDWKYCHKETAKRLAELGLPQGQTEKTWSVVTHDDGADITLFHTDDCGDDFPNEETYTAPDLSEAMRVLGRVEVVFQPMFNRVCFVPKNPIKIHIEEWDNKTIFPAEAACRMIEWLAENGLINLKEVRL